MHVCCQPPDTMCSIYVDSSGYDLNEGRCRFSLGSLWSACRNRTVRCALSLGFRVSVGGYQLEGIRWRVSVNVSSGYAQGLSLQLHYRMMFSIVFIIRKLLY